MARESITDLVYQFLRSLVHASFRDGAISGLRDAFGLPPPDEDDDRRNGDGTTSSRSSIEIRIANGLIERERKSLPAEDQPPAKKSAKALAGPDAQVKRGRGRPRKLPTDAKPPAGEEASS